MLAAHTHTRATQLWGFHSGINLAHLLGFVYSICIDLIVMRSQAHMIRKNIKIIVVQIKLNEIALHSRSSARQCTYRKRIGKCRETGRTNEKEQTYSECLQDKV